MRRAVLFHRGVVEDVHEADRITNGVTGIHIYITPAKRDTCTPTGDNVLLTQASDLSGNFADVNIVESGTALRIQENELNGQAILELKQSGGDQIQIGGVSDSKLFYDGSPHRVYDIINVHQAPTSAFFAFSSRSSGATSGYYTVINATTQTVTIFSRAEPAGKLYDITSSTGLSLDTWYKIETHYRGYNHATLNDAELKINDVLEAFDATAFNRSATNDSQHSLRMHGTGTPVDTDHAFQLVIDDTGKSDATVTAEDVLIQDVISNLFGL